MVRELMKEMGLDWALNPPSFKKILPKNSFEVYCVVRDSIDKGHKFYIRKDCDPDGYYSALAWDVTLSRIGYTNYSVSTLKKRSHNIEWEEIKEQLDDGARCIIIVDSSTNDIELINNIVNYNEEVRLIIIDHHQTKYTYSKYPERCTIVNPKMESDKMPYHHVSAGVLNALICDYILSKYGHYHNKDLILMGYVTMYSDTCKVSNAYVAGMMRYCLNETRNVPRQIGIMMNDYSSLNKNYISFNLINNLNALLRLERYDIIDKLFDNRQSLNPEEFLSEVTEVKKESNSIIESLKDTIQINDLKDIVVGILPYGLPRVYYNFMGIIAANLANEHNKIALCVYLDIVTNCYIGSARDANNRDILSEFSTYFSKSQGHTSAFGVTIERDKLTILPEIISQATLKNTKIPDIVIEYSELVSNNEILEMAVYNELTIIGLPRLVLKTTVNGDFSIKNGEKRSQAVSSYMTLVKFGGAIERYTDVVCIPNFNGNRVECRIE